MPAWTDDLIYIGDMLSWRAFEFFADERGWDWMRPWIEPHWLAWFIEILKQSEDTPHLFPNGKWATIQHLQEKVAALAAGHRWQASDAMRQT